MSGAMLALGGAALGFLYPFAAIQLWDAYRHRDHPTVELRAESCGWVVDLGLWTLAVGVAARRGGAL